jgi:hypothetical protein
MKNMALDIKKETITPTLTKVELKNARLLQHAKFVDGQRYVIYHHSEFACLRLHPEGKYVVSGKSITVPWADGNDKVVAVYSPGMIEIATDMMELIGFDVLKDQA